MGQDALRGKRLYLDGGRLNGSGLSCVDCHGGIPGALHGIGKAAGNPGAIDYALGTVSQMTPLRGRLNSADIADLAAYIGDPDVPSPELRLSVQDATGITTGRERLELHAATGESSSGVLVLSNAGKLPLRWLSAPFINGPGSDGFHIASTDCSEGTQLAPQQNCSVQVGFRGQPRSQGQPRTLSTAALGIRHDWLGGGVYVALIGRTSVSPGAGKGRSAR